MLNKKITHQQENSGNYLVDGVDLVLGEADHFERTQYSFVTSTIIGPLVEREVERIRSGTTLAFTCCFVYHFKVT